MTAPPEFRKTIRTDRVTLFPEPVPVRAWVTAMDGLPETAVAAAAPFVTVPPDPEVTVGVYCTVDAPEGNAPDARVPAAGVSVPPAPLPVTNHPDPLIAKARVALPKLVSAR